MNPAKAIEAEFLVPDQELELVRRCTRGDEQALRLLFVAHEPSLRRLIVRVIGSVEDAEEISAETFMKFWRTAGRYRGEGSLRAYLARIALNLARDRLRKRRPRVEMEPFIASRENEDEILFERIRAGLFALEPLDRELLTMYYLNDWAYEEICAAMDIKYEVLRTRLVRARKRLRAILGVEDE